MATITINSVTLGCTPSAQFNTTIEYKVSGGLSYTLLGTFLTNTNGTLVDPQVITGLLDDTCYDIRVTCDYSGVCGSFEDGICTGAGTTTTTTSTTTTSTTTTSTTTTSTTTTSTTTTSTSTSTTTTTTAAITCNLYQVTGTPSISVEWEDCATGSVLSTTFSGGSSGNICARTGTMSQTGGSGTIVEGVDCSEYPSTTTTTTEPLDSIYYGAKASASVPNSSQILAGILSLQDGELDVTVDWTSFNGTPQYVWWAIPALTANHNKNTWYASAFNNGNMGNPGDLFETISTVNVSGQDYYVGISSYETQFTTTCNLIKI